MATALCYRAHAYFSKLLDWTCLERCPLYKTVMGVLIVDFSLIVISLLSSQIFYFVYTNPAGRSGFVDDFDYDIIAFFDAYKYRRHQPWELQEPIDWEVGDRKQINVTRTILDEKCSTYANNASVPGDHGDYLREVMGHPNSSGFNGKLKDMVTLWLTAFLIQYFCFPLLLLLLWWKRQRTRLVILFVVLRVISLFLLVAVNVVGKSHTMCALDFVLDVPFRPTILIVTVVIWILSIFQIVVVSIYCLEQNLSKKRRDYGFRRRRPINKKKVIVAETSKEDDKDTQEQHDNDERSSATALKTSVGAANGAGEGLHQDDDDHEHDHDEDVEQILNKEKKRFSTKVPGKRTQGSNLTAKAIAREILELGSTTESETAYETRVKQEEEKRKKKKSVSHSLAKKEQQRKNSAKVETTPNNTTGLLRGNEDPTTKPNKEYNKSTSKVTFS